MAEKAGQSFVQPTPSGKEELGKIEVAAEVLEIVAGIAATEVEGIAETRGNFASGVVERFGKKVHNKGIKSGVADNGDVIIDVFCSIKYGFSIPKVAKDMQAQIRQSIQTMTAIETAEVNVHITDIHFD
ncbi:hypothetical protein GCM10007425_10720 [Lysinibacillus alkalisoli]|uniref:Asp23/Gls24 family envelope stress response protein n=1 Tax=Lysinibacillus alkalisoli TaxID=1911548 RepID=A0A917G1E1_9BACI|nr:Asp23/Gls24 family envelope stress response protein [Lysinibacillus alkalisoli]GGG18131.1 hypothetical protein GCM10007425_10720 [Lysinibacillus alkalisoli]